MKRTLALALLVPLALPAAAGEVLVVDDAPGAGIDGRGSAGAAWARRR